MEKKAIIILELEDMIEAVRIITDRDKDKALAFMDKYVERAIRDLDHGHCQPIFEWYGKKEPDMLKQLKGKKNV